MQIEIRDSPDAMGSAAASHSAAAVRAAIDQRGAASIIVATGASQLPMLTRLVQDSTIDWSKVTSFHLDEYIGLPESHPASFRRYLRERFVEQVPLKEFHYVNGEAADVQAECARLGSVIADHPIDVAFIGIGENAHIAFNDPPADFETSAAYLAVDLDDACRHQQFSEGWFGSLDAVPKTAISMSVRQILKSKTIVCTVPDQRKAKAVQQSVEGDVIPEVPASILQQHGDTTLFLDQAAASLLKNSVS